MANYPLSVSTNITLLAASTGRSAATFVDSNGIARRIYVAEMHNHRRSLQDQSAGITYTRQFIIHGSSDPAECIGVGPQRGDFMNRAGRLFVVTNRTIEEYGKDHTNGENKCCLLNVTYAIPAGGEGNGGGDDEAEQDKAADPFQSRLTIGIGGESVHVTEAISQTTYKGGPFSLGNTIGITDDGVEGVDINAPIMSFSEVHYVPSNRFTAQFVKSISALAFTVNDDLFRGFDAGEVIFTGMNASPVGGAFECTFNFEVRPNDEWAIEVISQIGDSDPIFQEETGPRKGWEYLWTRNVEVVREDNDGNGQKWRAASSVSVAQVYPEKSFSSLGIGTQPWAATPGLADVATVEEDAPTPSDISTGAA